MNNFFKNLSFVAVFFIVSAAGFVFWERQFFIRYFTHTGDLLALPISWSKPVEIVKGMQSDTLPVVKDKDLTIHRDILNDVSSYAESTGSQSLIVMHNGAVQIEKYCGGAERGTFFNPQSMSKTVLGMLIGIAISEGHITSVEDSIGKYIEEWSNDPRGDATIRQALWMSAGLEQMAESYEMNIFSRGVRYNLGDDFEGMILDLKQVDTPGSNFDYNNEETNLLGILIERATGRRYAQYLSEKLWRPLGLAEASMYLDMKGGSVMKSCCIFSRPYDWVKIGQLMKDRGRFEERQLVPEEWIDEMVTSSDNAAYYGYQVWLGSGYIPQKRFSLDTGDESGHIPFLADDMIVFLGYGGQRVWVSPSHDLVIVRSTVQWADTWQESKIPNLIISSFSTQKSSNLGDGKN